MIGLYSTSSRYGAVAQAFHWLTIILVLAAYIMSKSDRYSLYSAGADGLRRIHETLGVLVFTIVVLRLSWGLIDRMSVKQPMSRWMGAAAKLVHAALYALLVAIPAAAVLGTWLEGIPVTLLGMDIAPPIAPQGAGQGIVYVHIALGNTILWLAGMHAAAAVFHRFYLRDDVFQSMIPGGSRQCEMPVRDRAGTSPMHKDASRSFRTSSGAALEGGSSSADVLR